jgi:nucleoside 2-deoxyribosyltransferase
MTTVYLAGRIDTIEFSEAKAWRDEIKSKLSKFDIEVICPTEVPQKLTNEDIFNRALSNVEKCDIFLVDIRLQNSENTGTAIELYYAWKLNKVIIGWTNTQKRRVFLDHLVLEKYHDLDSIIMRIISMDI